MKCRDLSHSRAITFLQVERIISVDICPKTLLKGCIRFAEQIHTYRSGVEEGKGFPVLLEVYQGF